LRRIREKVSLPLIAIGGIDQTNIEEVMKAGANGVAVISAVLGAEDVEGAARELAARIEQFRSTGGSEGGESNR
jgi:thiamine-phosphate pyrophosphorylase